MLHPGDLDRLCLVERAFGLTSRTGGPDPFDARVVHAALLCDMLATVQAALGPGTTPATPLADLIGDRRADVWLADLSDRTDLDLVAALVPSAAGLALRTGLAIGLSGLAVGLSMQTGEWGGLLLMLALPAVTLLPVPPTLPRRLRTLGQLLHDRLPSNLDRLRTPILPGESAGRDGLLRAMCDRITPPAGRRPLHTRHPSPEATPWPT